MRNLHTLYIQVKTRYTLGVGEGMSKVNQRQINSDHGWLMTQNLTQYAGQWLAVSNRKILTRDRNLKKVVKTISKMSLPNVHFYRRVPEVAIVI